MFKSETLTYNATSTTIPCDVQKQLDIQRWILDPSSRPYPTKEEEQRLVAHSASTERTKSIAEKQLELQRMILGESY